MHVFIYIYNIYVYICIANAIIILDNNSSVLRLQVAFARSI